MPAPIVIAGLLAAGATVFGKVYDSIANRVGKKQAKKAVEKAVALQQKDTRSPQEEAELKSLMVQYPEIQQGFSQYGATSNDPRFAKYSQPQMQAMGALRQFGMNQLQNNPYSLQDVANEEVRKFRNETVPSIASRFSASGTLQSGAFNRALARAQTDAESRLRALGFQQQGEEKNRGLRALELGLQPEYGSSGLGFGGMGQQQPTFGAQLGGQLGSLLSNPEFINQAGSWLQQIGANRAAKQNAFNEPYSYTESPKYQI